MLPDVKTKILDGAMGVAGASATGIFAAVGVSAIPSNGILTLVDAGDVDEKIGDGPLRDLIVSALSVAKTTVYAIALQGSVAGSLSAVLSAPANTGGGTLAVSGSPRNEYDVSVEIVSPGGLNEAAFRVTLDGAAGKVITVPDNGQYVIPNTGITLAFSAEGVAFAEGDSFAFSSSEPQASNSEVLAAVDQILDAKLSIEWIAVAGVSSAPLWAALAAKAEGAEAVYQYLFFVAQARYLNPGETADQWTNALAGTERGVTTSTRLQICAGWIEEADSNNGQTDVRGLIGAYCGKLASLDVHEGPDAVKHGSISAATALMPPGINDGHIETLKNSGYVTARKIIGLKGIYITSGQMASESGSDYDLVERRRVMDKACREIRVAQLPHLNANVGVGADGSPEGLEMFVAQGEAPLRTMITNKQISDGYIIIPDGQNILSTKTLRTKIRIVPLGKMSYIENEIAYSNPALG